MTKNKPNYLNKRIYDDISKELDIDKRVIEVVVRSQFSFVKRIMESDDWRPILLHYWGTYFPRHNKIKAKNEDKQ
tara:strand:+ start:2502 stop:2726 length:225 start_codon:yes stop_codon:yes gene_type:complete